MNWACAQHARMNTSITPASVGIESASVAYTAPIRYMSSTSDARRSAVPTSDEGVHVSPDHSWYCASVAYTPGIGAGFGGDATTTACVYVISPFGPVPVKMTL